MCRLITGPGRSRLMTALIVSVNASSLLGMVVPVSARAEVRSGAGSRAWLGQPSTPPASRFLTMRRSESRGEAVVGGAPAQLADDRGGRGFGVDHDELRAQHLGEVAELLGPGRDRQHGVVRAAVQGPTLGRGGQAR